MSTVGIEQQLDAYSEQLMKPNYSSLLTTGSTFWCSLDSWCFLLLEHCCCSATSCTLWLWRLLDWVCYSLDTCCYYYCCCCLGLRGWLCYQLPPCSHSSASSDKNVCAQHYLLEGLSEQQLNPNVVSSEQQLNANIE